MTLVCAYVSEPCYHVLTQELVDNLMARARERSVVDEWKLSETSMWFRVRTNAQAKRVHKHIHGQIAYKRYRFAAIIH